MKSLIAFAMLVLSFSASAVELFPAQSAAVTAADRREFTVNPNVTIYVVGTLGAGESVTLQRKRGNAWVTEDVLSTATVIDGIISQAGDYRILKTATAQPVTVDLRQHSANGSVTF